MHCGEEDRHQNIMRSVALKKGVEEPWIVDVLGYLEITLKGVAKPAINAFRNRVAEMCKAEGTTEDAVRGDKPSNGVIENTVMPRKSSEQSNATLKNSVQEELREDSLVVPWLVEDAGSMLSTCLNGRDGRTPSERSRLVRRCWQGRSQQNP